MKTPACTLVLLFISVFCLKAQLNLKHNGIRIGDEIIKQQVEYKEPGQAGKNQLWDFSKLKTINDAYELTYSLPPIQGDSLYMMGDNHFNVKKTRKDELIVGTEHNTMYYFRLRNDSLLLLGHENPSVRLCYTQPITNMVYPINYGDKVRGTYESQGLYSGTVDFKTKGSVEIQADAYGKMMLPTGDTLNPVLRIKTIKTIFNPQEDETISTTGDVGKQLETYQWYTKGYRYPIFETVRNINLTDNSEIFSTAFFFPPQEHYYLDTDPENLAILDSLWKIQETNNLNKTLEQAKTVSIEDYITCRIYPNPVQSVLNLDYELKQDATVMFELYSMDGVALKRIKAISKSAGSYFETLDCSGLYPRSYVLRMTVNGFIINEKIIKK